MHPPFVEFKDVWLAYNDELLAQGHRLLEVLLPVAALGPPGGFAAGVVLKQPQHGRRSQRLQP